MLGGGAPALLAPQQPTTTLQQAVNGNTLGVGYAGGGFMLFYYIGVSKILQQLGILKPGTYKTAGSSVGVIAQMVDHPGFVNHEVLMNASVAIAKRCRERRNCMQTLDEELVRMLKVIVRPGQAAIFNNTACTAVTWYGKDGRAVPEGVCTYKDDDDLRATMRAACYVPGWSGYGRAIEWRGKDAYDGAFDQIQPCPPNVTYCIKIAGWSEFDVKRYLAMLEPMTALRNINDTLATLQGMLGSSPLDVMRTSLERDTLGTLNVPMWIRMLTRASLPGTADIWPGKYSKLSLTPLQQLLGRSTPPDEAKIELLYRMGQEDAAGWAREQGWAGTPAAAQPARPAAAAVGGRRALLVG